MTSERANGEVPPIQTSAFSMYNSKRARSSLKATSNGKDQKGLKNSSPYNRNKSVEKKVQFAIKEEKEKEFARPILQPIIHSSLVDSSAAAKVIQKSEVVMDGVKSKPLIINDNSIAAGLRRLESILDPIKVDQFFQTHWEKRPIFRNMKNSPEHFKSLVSFEEIDEMLLNQHIEFTKNLDVTFYKNGKRTTVDLEGKAVPSIVWKHYNEGCSIRLLNPQSYLPEIKKMCSELQEFFHCMVGCNIYITPPNSQGFAPHFDDIEAFVLQVEGKKRWKLYKPRSPEEKLPRYSSRNFKEEELAQPVFEKVLEPGCVLYFPRGFVHQASTYPECPSLHITLSVYQKHAYADLLEILIPKLLASAIPKDVNYRRGLPMQTWSDLGVVHENRPSSFKDMMHQNLKKLFDRMWDETMIDDAVDEMAKKFQHDALPPVINAEEKMHTVFGQKTIINQRGRLMKGFKCTLETKVRLLRANILRIVREEDDGEIKTRLYFYMENSKFYHEYEPNFIEIESECVRGVKDIINKYPLYLRVADINLNNNGTKIDLVQSLWDKGLLMSEATIFDA